ncbi:MAG: NUDIX hydrolase [Acidimicrobiia bacterium]
MTVVRAAGGLVRRRGDDGRWRYVLVHRPRYDDWSLPKGKADPGERAEETARREVEEETGLHCRLLDELRTVEYRDRNGRRKVVRYWLMEPLDATHEFRPTAEVDEVRWCEPADAVKLLTYDHDRALVAERGNDG